MKRKDGATEAAGCLGGAIPKSHLGWQSAPALGCLGNAKEIMLSRITQVGMKKHSTNSSVFAWRSAKSRLHIVCCLLLFLRQINSILNLLLVLVQWETNCSTKTLEHVLSSLRSGQLGELVRSGKGKEMPKSVKQFDKKSQKMVSIT